MRQWWWLWVALALPLAGLGLLLLSPRLDVAWEHHPSHFWLVLGTALVSVALAFVTNEAANRRADARLVLISLAFLSAAGFLGLHALATPGVLLPSPNAGFVMATPIGLMVASAFAAASVSRVAGPRSGFVLRHRASLRTGLIVGMAAWAAVSLLRLPPLNGPLPPEEANGPVAVMALGAVGLYAFGAWRYTSIYRRRRSNVSLAIIAALVLLAEAMVAVALSRNWHLSWWEWHVLMTAAFGVIALGVRSEYARTGSLAATFQPIYQRATLARLDRWHARAISDIADAQGSGRSVDRILEGLRQEGASADELALMAEAAREIRRVDELFRPYLPQHLAGRLRADPDVGRLGGEERQVSAMFADLAGFTTFSESRRPTDVVAMLNAYWAVVVPIIDRAGGAVEHFAGDGILVLFNTVTEQPDHPLRAARCALAIQRETAPLAAAQEGWPRFRIGLNTGAALVGNVGAQDRRSFAAIGDTTNLAARLTAAGGPGQVVIGPGTQAYLAGATEASELRLEALGEVRVKGKREPVMAWSVTG